MENRVCERCGAVVTGPGIPGLSALSERYYKQKGAFICPGCFAEVIQAVGEERFHEIIGDQPVPGGGDGATPEDAAETEVGQEDDDE